MTQSLEESIAVQKREAAAASIQKIALLHQECCDADEGIRTAILAKINKARECGLELLEHKKRIPHGEWEKQFTKTSHGKENLNPVLDFTSMTASIYMRFGKANPDPITELADGIMCLKDALIASGSLSAPSGHGPQALHQFDFLGGFTKRTFDFRAFFGNEIKKVPVSEWPESRKETVRDELEWFAKTYVELGGRL